MIVAVMNTVMKSRVVAVVDEEEYGHEEDDE